MESKHFREKDIRQSSLDELLEAGWEVPAELEVIAPSNRAEERVERILQALPEKYREVLKCHFLLKLSVKATALKLGVTEANVKVLQFRALKHALISNKLLRNNNVDRCRDIPCNARSERL